MNKFEKVSIEQYRRDLEKAGYTLYKGDVWDDADGQYWDSNFIYDHIQLPRRATVHSAGYDFFLPVGVEIPAYGQVNIPTGIKARLKPDCVLLLVVRSSMGIKRGLSLANTVGVIDADYYNNPTNEGEIHIVLRNDASSSATIKAGERIAQGIIVRYETAADESAPQEKRVGGIGSTD